MAKNRPRPAPKRRASAAKALEAPIFRQQIVPNKKKKKEQTRVKHVHSFCVDR